MDGYPGITDRDAAEILFRDEKTTERNVRANDQGKLAKKTMYQNLGIISLTFLLLFSAFHSLQSLQTSIHVADGLNNIGIIVLNVTFMVSCMFLPPFILSKFGLKKTIMFSMLGYVSYTAASLFTNWLTIIPASVVLGVLASTLWTGQMCFVTQLAIMYSEVTGANLKVSSSRFFGIFYAVYYTGKLRRTSLYS